MTSQAPQSWFVLLKDDASAGRVIVPLKPFLRFSRRMQKRLAHLERKSFEAIPQLARRAALRSRRSK